jgi:deazaflavin-dependent oxidoreductase (nitroreductase family)
MFLIASKAGAPSHPDWYHNLVANPSVTVELGAETFEAKATVADPETRDRLYALQASQMANFAEYAKATTRTIPIVLVNRSE